MGIGTTGPETRLDLSNSGDDTTYNQYIRFGAHNSPGSNSGGIIWKPEYTNYTKESAAIRAIGEGNYFRLGLGFFTQDASDWTTNAIERMRIDKSGNVGIGTTTPATPLTVKGVMRAIRSDGTAYINVSNEAGVATLESSSGWFYFNKTVGDWTNPTMVMSPTGNVGIGTVSPQAILHVKGGATATIIERVPASDGDATLRVENAVGSGNMIFLAPGAAGAVSRIFTSYNTTEGALLLGTHSNRNNQLYLATSGYVGIGTTNPTRTLYVKNNGSANEIITAQGSAATSASEQYINLINDDSSQNIYLEVNGSTNTASAGTRTYAPRLESNGTRGLGISAYQGPLNFWTGSSVNAMTMDTSGNISGVYGNYHVSSDILRKKDIVTIPNALEKVLSLRGVNFRWKDSKPDDNLHMGMIAQEVEKVVPEVVHTADDEMKTKAVEYQYVVGLLVEAMKELKSQNDTLKARIEALEKKL